MAALEKKWRVIGDYEGGKSPVRRAPARRSGDLRNEHEWQVLLRELHHGRHWAHKHSRRAPSDTEKRPMAWAVTRHRACPSQHCEAHGEKV